MKHWRVGGLFGGFIMLGWLSGAYASTWQIDPVHSTIGFTIRHMMVSNVRGSFEKFKGTVQLNEEDITRSSVHVTILAPSLTTHQAKRDKHLRSADFFDVSKYPTLTFQSTQVERTGEGLKVTGDLSLHGITKPVVLTVRGPTPAIKDPFGDLRRGASATSTIKRKDFGLKWNKALETGGIMVGDDVAIEIEAEFTRKAA